MMAPEDEKPAIRSTSCVVSSVSSSEVRASILTRSTSRVEPQNYIGTFDGDVRTIKITSSRCSTVPPVNWLPETPTQ
jgi:hypothetical protein